MRLSFYSRVALAMFSAGYGSRAAKLSQDDQLVSLDNDWSLSETNSSPASDSFFNDNSLAQSTAETEAEA